MTIRIWVDAWQMQCCGRPFSVGEEVEWTLYKETDREYISCVTDSDLARSVDFGEEHHGGVPDDAPATHGTVRRIQVVQCRFGPRPGDDSKTHYPVAGSGLTTDVASADGWDKVPDGYDFPGYVVDIDLRPNRGLPSA